MKTIKNIILLLVLGSNSLLAQTQMSLDDAMKYALNNNLSIKNSKLNIDDAEARIKENGATALPQISGELGVSAFYLKPQVVLPASFSDGTPRAVFGILNAYGVKDGQGNLIPGTPPANPNAGAPLKVSFVQTFNITPVVTASELLFSGSYNVAKKAATMARDLAAKQLAGKEMEIKNAVVDAYLPTLIMNEGLKTFDKNISSLEKLLFETKAINKEGFVENLDVERLTLSLENVKAERENLLRQKEIVLSALKFAMGMPLTSALDVSDDLSKLTQSVDEMTLMGDVNFKKRADYNVIESAQNLQNLTIELNKASALPTVAAFMNFQYGFQGNSFKKNEGFWIPQGLIGLNAKFPLYDFGIRKYGMQRAVIASETVKNQKSDFERVVNLQVEIARIAYKNAQKRIETQQKNLKLAEKIYNTTKIKYKEGIGSSIEIIQAETALFQTQQTLTQAQYDLLKAKMDIKKALGL